MQQKGTAHNSAVCNECDKANRRGDSPARGHPHVFVWAARLVLVDLLVDHGDELKLGEKGRFSLKIYMVYMWICIMFISIGSNNGAIHSGRHTCVALICNIKDLLNSLLVAQAGQMR